MPGRQWLGRCDLHNAASRIGQSGHEIIHPTRWMSNHMDHIDVWYIDITIRSGIYHTIHRTSVDYHPVGTTIDRDW